MGLGGQDNWGKPFLEGANYIRILQGQGKVTGSMGGQALGDVTAIILMRAKSGLQICKNWGFCTRQVMKAWDTLEVN